MEIVDVRIALPQGQDGQQPPQSLPACELETAGRLTIEEAAIGRLHSVFGVDLGSHLPAQTCACQSDQAIGEPQENLRSGSILLAGVKEPQQSIKGIRFGAAHFVLNPGVTVRSSASAN